MSAQCRRMGAGTVGVEWGGNGWPVLKSTQDVAREEGESDPGGSKPEETQHEARGTARAGVTREEDK